MGLRGLLSLLLGLLVAAALLPAAAATAAPPAAPQPAPTADPSAPAAEDPLSSLRRPAVRGTPRYGRTLRATAGRWSARPTALRWEWLREGRVVDRGPRHRVAAGDVGARLRVRVVARAAGHRPGTALSARTARVQHRVPVRRTVTYDVRTRGRVAGLAQFRRLVQRVYDDPRGWRAAGIRFRQVRRGGTFTVVLAQAWTLPSFSPVCSPEWSCRVGRHVVINQTRWRRASPAWNADGRSLLGYRHMVLNHETGHWLGHGHASCPRRGRPAPVMMQQSKGRDGCRFNPWPTAAELARTS